MELGASSHMLRCHLCCNHVGNGLVAVVCATFFRGHLSLCRMVMHSCGGLSCRVARYRNCLHAHMLLHAHAHASHLLCATLRANCV